MVCVGAVVFDQLFSDWLYTVVLMGLLFWHGVSCGLNTCWGFALANFVGVWLGLCSCMVLSLFSLCVGLGFGQMLVGCMA